MLGGEESLATNRAFARLWFTQQSIAFSWETAGSSSWRFWVERSEKSNRASRERGRLTVAFFREHAERLFPAMVIHDEVTRMPVGEANE